MYFVLLVFGLQFKVRQTEISGLVIVICVLSGGKVGACDWNAPHRVLQAIVGIVGSDDGLAEIGIDRNDVDSCCICKGAAEPDDLLICHRSVDGETDGDCRCNRGQEVNAMIKSLYVGATFVESKARFVAFEHIDATRIAWTQSTHVVAVGLVADTYCTVLAIITLRAWNGAGNVALLP